jgi:hypothetical protein
MFTQLFYTSNAFATGNILNKFDFVHSVGKDAACSMNYILFFTDSQVVTDLVYNKTTIIDSDVYRRTAGCTALQF